MPFGDRQDRVHVAGVAPLVDDGDDLGVLGQRGLECLGVQAAGVGVDVGEDHVTAQREDGAQRGVVGERRSHDIHPFAHAEGEVGGEERAGAGVEGDRVAGAAVQEGEEVGFEPADGAAVALDGDVGVPLRGQLGQLRLVRGGRPHLVGQWPRDGGCAPEEGEPFVGTHVLSSCPCGAGQAHRSAIPLVPPDRAR